MNPLVHPRRDLSSFINDLCKIVNIDVLREFTFFKYSQQPIKKGDEEYAPHQYFSLPRPDKEDRITATAYLAIVHSNHILFDGPERVLTGDIVAFRFASGAIPALYIAGIAHAAHGAAPYGFHDQYADDEAVLTRYAAQAGTQAGFERFISQWLGESQPQLATV